MTVSIADIMAWPHTAPLENFNAGFCGSRAEACPTLTENWQRPSSLTHGATTYSYNSSTVALVTGIQCIGNGSGWVIGVPLRHLKTMWKKDRWCVLPCKTGSVSYTHLRAHETRHDLVCRLLLEKKKTN